MLRSVILLAIGIISGHFALAQLPAVSSGTITRLEHFNSKFVTPRNIDIWLPEGYSNQKPLAVLYMHDGQMLFDSTKTWNHKAWEVDDAISQLKIEGKIKDVMVVGIWNDPATRHADYFPQKPFETLTQIEKDTLTARLQMAGRSKEGFQPVSDKYLKFLVTELKPFIDSNYNTAKTPEHTFIAGSSMGGLISLYAICEYPNVFGGAACLSTHWPGEWSPVNNPAPDAFLNYLKKHLPVSGLHKIYFDCGDQNLDALYPVIQKKADKIMEAGGYTKRNWITRYFPGEGHSEDAWRKRLHIPFTFLLKKTTK